MFCWTTAFLTVVNLCSICWLLLWSGVVLTGEDPRGGLGICFAAVVFYLMTAVVVCSGANWRGPWRGWYAANDRVQPPQPAPLLPPGLHHRCGERQLRPFQHHCLQPHGKAHRETKSSTGYVVFVLTILWNYWLMLTSYYLYMYRTSAKTLYRIYIWKKYSQKGNCEASILIATFIYLWALYIFPPSVRLFGCRKRGGPILGI
jgi:hypothetical protein